MNLMSTPRSNGAATNEIQANLNVLELEYNESFSEDINNVDIEGSGEQYDDEVVDKFNTDDSPDLFQDVSQK